MGTGWALILGVAAGWMISRLMRDKEINLKAGVQKAKQKINELKPEKMDSESKQKLEEMFDGNQDLMGIFQDIRSSLKAKLESLKNSAQKIDRSKYVVTVHEIIRDYENRLTLPEDQIEKIQHYLENDYDRIRNDLNRSSENTET
jgi:uncharacterized membrane-anchored protein YhcB (DUF1043 family)